MSRLTDDFWSGFGWGLIWLGFFGGIALVIWAAGVANSHGNQLQIVCAQQHGTWKLVPNKQYEYACSFEGKK